MHLYSIIETVLYVFHEAILNKSVYSLKQHLTTNHSEIPYNAHAINAMTPYNKVQMNQLKPPYTDHRIS